MIKVAEYSIEIKERPQNKGLSRIEKRRLRFLFRLNRHFNKRDYVIRYGETIEVFKKPTYSCFECFNLVKNQCIVSNYDNLPNFPFNKTHCKKYIKKVDDNHQFILFLKELNILEIFKNYLKKFQGIKSDREFYRYISTTNLWLLILSAFYFRDTQEGLDFWHDIHKKWIKRILK